MWNACHKTDPPKNFIHVRMEEGLWGLNTQCGRYFHDPWATMLQWRGSDIWQAWEHPLAGVIGWGQESQEKQHGDLSSCAHSWIHVAILKYVSISSLVRIVSSGLFCFSLVRSYFLLLMLSPKVSSLARTTISSHILLNILLALEMSTVS